METIDGLLAYAWVRTLLGCVILAVVAWVSAWLSRHILIRVMSVVSRRTVWTWDDAMVKRGVFRRLAKVVPLVIIQYGILLVPGVSERVEAGVSSISSALIVVCLLMAVSAALTTLEDLYRASPRGHERSIKGYIQLLKIVLFAIGTIIVLGYLIGKSPLTLLAGLGAVSAVLLLIFKDTIMSVVASVQLGTNDMLRVGDWISLPDDNVDGDVIEVALHTVKVVNWDKTISTVPTWHLISKSYRNYRNMYATGRRISRALNIDVTSVRFLTSEEIDHLRQFKPLSEYFQRKEKDLAQWNADISNEGWSDINARRLTNLGSFRAYMQGYIRAHPGINKDLLWAVRQLDPEPTGIPLQIYAYTVKTSFVPHHNVQGDIFDHLITILPEFGLSLYQQPSGADMRVGLSGRAGTSSPQDTAGEPGLLQGPET